MAVLQVRRLSYRYEENRAVLEQVDFSVEEGETLAIVGLSGSGKTTLCHCLCGLIPHVLGGRMKGGVYLDGRPLAEIPLPRISREVGLVFQEPDNQMVTTTVEDEIAFGPENLCLPPAEIRSIVDGLLDFFGLSELRLRNPLQLSGGQKQLVAIASVLALQPRVLVLDEPMSHLDPQGQQMVEQALKKLAAERMTVILVEHSLARAAWADRWLVLAEGRAVRLDPPGTILEDRPFLRAQNLLYD